MNRKSAAFAVIIFGMMIVPTMSVMARNREAKIRFENA